MPISLTAPVPGKNPGLSTQIGKFQNNFTESKFEISVRILGNEFVAIKIAVDDMKQKWIVLGLISIVAMAWAGSMFGPTLIGMFGQ